MGSPHITFSVPQPREAIRETKILYFTSLRTCEVTDIRPSRISGQSSIEDIEYEYKKETLEEDALAEETPVESQEKTPTLLTVKQQKAGACS